MFFLHFASVTIKEWQVVLSSVEGTLLTGFFVLAPTITQENPTRENFFWSFRQAVMAYLCETCDKQFTVKANFDRHVKLTSLIQFSVQVIQQKEQEQNK